MAKPFEDSGAALNRYIAWGLFFSLMVHLAMMALFTKQPPQQFDTPVFVDIDLDRPAPPRVAPPPATKQLVTTPERRKSAEEAPDTRLASERNVKVEKEQIKHGDEQAGPAIGEKGPPAPKQPSRPQREQQKQPEEQKEPRRERAAPEKRLSAQDLRLDSETMQNEFALNNPQKRSANPLEINHAAALSSYTPFSRPFGSGARFLGSQGSNDYLPNLPDGDITLLNTKADQFAVFVRRVATQVFTQMRSQGWDILRGGDIRAATQFAVVHAILSPRGDLMRVTIESSSGSLRFDKLLEASAQSGARDPNPPKGAEASDGNIHFIFESRSWVDTVPEPRTGFPVERRWVLLGTGLE